MKGWRQIKQHSLGCQRSCDKGLNHGQSSIRPSILPRSLYQVASSGGWSASNLRGSSQNQLLMCRATKSILRLPTRPYSTQISGANIHHTRSIIQITGTAERRALSTAGKIATWTEENIEVWARTCAGEKCFCEAGPSCPSCPIQGRHRLRR